MLVFKNGIANYTNADFIKDPSYNVYYMLVPKTLAGCLILNSYNLKGSKFIAQAVDSVNNDKIFVAPTIESGTITLLRTQIYPFAG